jgi:hypothetical protein
MAPKYQRLWDCGTGLGPARGGVGAAALGVCAALWAPSGARRERCLGSQEERPSGFNVFFGRVNTRMRGEENVRTRP